MTKNGTPLRIKDIALVAQGPKIRLGQFARAIHREDGKIIDNDDVCSGIVLLRKGANADEALRGIHEKVKELNERILPAGVKVVPFIDRSDLLHFTTHTVLHNLTEGILLVVIILFLFLGNVRGATIVALTIPFSLLFAATCLKLKGIPANLLSLGALDFGMVVDGAVVMVENIVRHMSHGELTHKTPLERIRDAATEVQRPVFYAIAIIITAYLPIFTLQRVEGRLFKPMAWTVAFALLGALLFSMLVAPVFAGLFFARGTREWRNPPMDFLKRIYREHVRRAIENRWWTVGFAGLALGVAGARESSRSHLVLFSTDRGQHGRGGQRRKRRARCKNLRRRLEASGRKGGPHCYGHARNHGDRRSWRIPCLGPAQHRGASGPATSRAAPNQRRRCSGCHPNSRRGHGSHPGAARRAALRSGPAVSATVPQHEGSHREHSPAISCRRARGSCAALRHHAAGRRIRNLSRREPTLRGH